MVGIVKSYASLLYANKPWYAYTGYRAVTTSPSHLDLALHPADRVAAYKSLAAIEPFQATSEFGVRTAFIDGIRSTLSDSKMKTKYFGPSLAESIITQ